MRPDPDQQNLLRAGACARGPQTGAKVPGASPPADPAPSGASLSAGAVAAPVVPIPRAAAEAFEGGRRRPIDRLARRALELRAISELGDSEIDVTVRACLSAMLRWTGQ